MAWLSLGVCKRYDIFKNFSIIGSIIDTKNTLKYVTINNYKLYAIFTDTIVYLKG